MLQLIVNNYGPLGIEAIGAQTSTDFGIVTEVYVSDPPPQLPGGKICSAAMKVGDSTYLFSKTQGFQVYNDGGKLLSIELPPEELTEDSDRLNHLLHQLVGEQQADAKFDVIVAAILGKTDQRRCGDWCWTNKSCLLTGCGRSCDWGRFACEGVAP